MRDLFLLGDLLALFRENGFVIRVALCALLFVDRGAGIGGYSVSVVPQSMVGKANDTNTPWTYVGQAGGALVSMRLDHTTKYFTVVSVWDRLGNERKCYSDGFVFDATQLDIYLGSEEAHKKYGRNELTHARGPSVRHGT